MVTASSRILRILPLLLLTLGLAACGGSGSIGAGPDLAGGENEAWPAHNWDGAVRSGAYAVVAVDSTERVVDTDLTGRLRVEVLEGAGVDTVTIIGTDLSHDHAYLHVQYDDSAVHPQGTRIGDDIDEIAIFLGVTSEPGVVSMGVATIGGEPTLTGEQELARVEFVPGAFTADHEAAEAAKSAVADLHFDTTATDMLQWSYTSTGDYDQNSEVNVSDLTPIGQYYQLTSAAPNWPAARVADGDKNNQVNISDLTPIGQNYRLKLTSYIVQSGPNASGPFADISGGNVAFGAGLVPGGGGFKQFSHTVASPIDGAFYVVVGADGASRAANVSNAALYSASGSPQLPPTGLTASSDGSQITLNWTAPVGAFPDGYQAFVATQSDMSDAQQMHIGSIAVTTFACPAIAVPVDQEHYFGVKAVYGVDTSIYTTFHYTVGADDAPQSLAAAQVGDHINLTWLAPPAGTPDGYTAYVGALPDMSDRQPMHLGLKTELTFDCPVIAVPPDVEHYFAVSATTGATEGGLSNIVHYTPGGGPDTTPPVWQGPAGITAAAPDDGKIIFSWSPAIDAASPPVSYLMYLVEDTEQIDWDAPIDVLDAAQTTYPAFGLTNGTKYKVAVRAQDSAATPNVTTNENFLNATPQLFPADGDIGTVIASDLAAVRVPGEEIPRIFAVNHTGELWYAQWDGTQWLTTEISTAVGNSDRKFHPQAVVAGTNIHIVYGTEQGVFEASSPLSLSIPVWDQKTITTDVTDVYGIGFSYSPSGDYFALSYACRMQGGAEKVFFSDRDAAGDWAIPASVMDGNPWASQCDMAINESNGSQWIVAGLGQSDQSGNTNEFWYATRAGRTGPWAVQNTGFGGENMVIEIDPTINQPVVSCARVRNVHIIEAGLDAPITDAVVFTWSGTTWLLYQIEPGSADYQVSDMLEFTTVFAGQDPQLVFSPSGLAVTPYSKIEVKFITDFETFETEGTVHGDLRRSTRIDTTWGLPTTAASFIPSSNAVTAGESYFHTASCNVGQDDSGSDSYITGKYSVRNDYVEGNLYYLREAW